MDSEKINKKNSKKSIAGFFAFIAAVVILLFFIIVQLLPASAGIKIIGFKTYLISDTKSMEPFLTHNDLVIVVNSDFDSLEKGDVITFMGRVTQNGSSIEAPVTHEIIEVITDAETGEKKFRTKGKNDETNPTADSRFVTKDGAGNTNKYIGKYAFKIRWLGKAIAFLRSPFGIVAIVINVIIIVLIVVMIKKKPEAIDGAEPDDGQNPLSGNKAKRRKKE